VHYAEETRNGRTTGEEAGKNRGDAREVDGVSEEEHTRGSDGELYTAIATEVGSYQHIS
jgi:hypothetical protein